MALALGQALIAVMAYRFLVRHVGLRWRMLVPLVLFLTSIPVVQISVWWATALNSTPFIACMLIVADHALRLGHGRRWGSYFWILGATAASLGFFEKSVLLPVVVALLLVAVTPVHNVVRAGLHVLRLHWPLFLGLVALLGGWYVAYRSNGTSSVVAGPNIARFADQLSSGLIGTFVPSLFGGPWDWGSALSSYNAVPTPGWVGLVLSVVVLAAGLFVATFGPRARRALLLVVVYGALVLLLINLGRAQFLVETSSLPRYYSDLVVVTVIASALALARLRDDPAPEMLTEWRPRRRTAAAISALVLAQLQIASFLVAVVAFAPGLGDGPEARWAKSSLTELRTVGPDKDFMDGSVPGFVIWALVFPFNQYSWFFAGEEDLPTFTGTVDQLLLIDDFGKVVPGRVQGPASVPGPVPDCGWLVRDAGTSVRMSTEVVRFDHMVHIAYIASAPTSLEISMGADPVRTVALEPGLHDIYTGILGGGRTVTLRATSPGATVCVSTVRLGQATTAPLEAAAP